MEDDMDDAEAGGAWGDDDDLGLDGDEDGFKSAGEGDDEEKGEGGGECYPKNVYSDFKPSTFPVKIASLSRSRSLPPIKKCKASILSQNSSTSCLEIVFFFFSKVIFLLSCAVCGSR